MKTYKYLRIENGMLKYPKLHFSPEQLQQICTKIKGYICDKEFISIENPEELIKAYDGGVRIWWNSGYTKIDNIDGFIIDDETTEYFFYDWLENQLQITLHTE